MINKAFLSTNYMYVYLKAIYLELYPLKVGRNPFYLQFFLNFNSNNLNKIAFIIIAT